VGLVGIMEVMATLWIQARKLGNHRGYRRSRLKINGKCHNGAAGCGEAWSDRIDQSDRFNFRMGFGLARLSISSPSDLEYDLRHLGRT